MQKISHNLYSFSVLAFSIITILALAVPTHAVNEQLTWMDETQNPTLRTAKSITSSGYNDVLSQPRGFARQECINKKITVSLSPRTYYDGCWYTTSIGMLEEDGKYLLEPGEKVAGYIENSVDNTAKLRPTLNPNMFIETINDHGTGYGFFVNFRASKDLKMNHTTSGSGRITLTYPTSGKRLKVPTNSVHVESSYIWYSDNAKWMVVFNDGGSFIRVNLETLAFSLVKLRDKPSGRWIPGMADITNDGRYVAATINGSSDSELYVADMDTCLTQESTVITESDAKCQKRTFKSSIQTNITPYRSISFPTFYSNHTLGFYHENSDHTYTQYLLQAPHTSEVTNNYLALGDSFASGEGAFEYEIGTDTLGQNMCHLSRKSYPYLINKQIALQDFHSVACSGARIEHITQKSQARRPDYNPLGNLVPGYQKQLQYILDSQQKPTIVTISAGGNNIGFAYKIRQCVLSVGSCLSSREDRQEITNEIDDQFDKLTKMYSELKNSLAPNAKIYAIGYPQIISDSTTASCGINVRLTTEERQLATMITKYLNNTIIRATQQAGVQYVDLENALVGYRLCETSSAAMAVNGITAGKDSGIGNYKFLGQESFHPNEKGHQLLKDAILSTTTAFTHESTAAVDGTKEIKETLLQAPLSHRVMRKKIYSNDLTDRQVLPGDTISLTGSAFQYDLPSNTRLDIALDGYDNLLGSTATDSNGSIQVNVTIPIDAETGIQAIHLYGKDAAGKDIDIYQYLQIIDQYEKIDPPTVDDNPDIPNSDEAPSNDAPQTPHSPSALLNFTLIPTIPHSDRVTARLGEQPYVKNDATTPGNHTLGASTPQTPVGSVAPKSLHSDHAIPPSRKDIVGISLLIIIPVATLLIYKVAVIFIRNLSKI